MHGRAQAIHSRIRRDGTHRVGCVQCKQTRRRTAARFRNNHLVRPKRRRLDHRAGHGAAHDHHTGDITAPDRAANSVDRRETGERVSITAGDARVDRRAPADPAREAGL